MDIVALRALIDTEPANAARSDLEVLGWLQELVDAPREVSVDLVRQYLITQIDGAGSAQRSSLDLIREVSESGTIRGATIPTTGGNAANLARMSGARAIWWMLGQGDAGAVFPVDDLNVRAEFVELGPSGLAILTNAQLSALDALAVEQQRRDVAADIGAAILGDVVAARAL